MQIITDALMNDVENRPNISEETLATIGTSFVTKIYDDNNDFSIDFANKSKLMQTGMQIYVYPILNQADAWVLNGRANQLVYCITNIIPGDESNFGVELANIKASNNHTHDNDIHAYFENIEFTNLDENYEIHIPEYLASPQADVITPIKLVAYVKDGADLSHYFNGYTYMESVSYSSANQSTEMFNLIEFTTIDGEPISSLISGNRVNSFDGYLTIARYFEGSFDQIGAIDAGIYHLYTENLLVLDQGGFSNYVVVLNLNKEYKDEDTDYSYEIMARQLYTEYANRLQSFNATPVDVIGRISINESTAIFEENHATYTILTDMEWELVDGHKTLKND